MLFRIWRLNHTHEHSDGHVLTYHRSTLIHYHMHYTNSATDSVVQQLTKYIHSYFAVLFPECHCTRPAQSGRGTASTIHYCEPNRVRAVPGRTRAKPARLQVTYSSLATNVTCDTLPRCEAPHEAGLPRTYRTVVTICTTSLTFTNSTFCPHSVFMYFVWTSEQTAIIYLFSTKWLVCITECLLRGTDWNIVQLRKFSPF
jgi:hypothetical protein